MARAWDGKKFDAVYSEFVCNHFGLSAPPDYCFRYRSRYKTLIKRFCDLASPVAMDVLDIGGGQLALLCKKLWNDRACVADLRPPLFAYLESQVSKRFSGISLNLCSRLWRDLMLSFSPK
jgi:hypothetical protein